MPRVSKNKDYLIQGLTISPSNPSIGDNVKLSYDGLLSKSGAKHIYAHVGYGKSWNNLAYFQMEKTPTGFEATIPITGSESLNLAFKDCANNWDNNTGKNYSYDVTH